MQRFKDILFVVTPDNNSSRSTFERVLTLAENNQARVKVIKVIDDFPYGIKLPGDGLSIKDLQANIIASHKDALEEWLASFEISVELHVKVLVGISFIEITREILRGGDDLVIKVAQSDGAGIAHIFGSDDMHLLRKCPCPVLLTKPGVDKAFHRILAAVDVDDNYLPKELNVRHLLNVEVLQIASSLALPESAEFYIVTAWRAIGESMMQSGFMQSSDEEVAEHVEEMRQQYVEKMDVLIEEVRVKLGTETMVYLEPIKQLLKGSPRQEISAFANDIEADLIVMGTVGRTGISGFIMGNTAEAILTRINCSVLAIKPEGFKTPITLED